MLDRVRIEALVESVEREKFLEIAQKQGRSMSGLIREFIQKEIRRHERKEKNNGN